MNQFPGTNYHDLNLNWLLGQMKNCLAEWETTKGEWTALEADNAEFKAYVTNYFNNLDLTQEISDKINALVEDGTLLRILTEDTGDGSPLSDVVGAWMYEYITTSPDGFVTNKTLTAENAAADAKATGDAIADLRDAFNDMSGWAGYSANQFSARDFQVSNTNNWAITNATATSITIVHYNTYGTGNPIAALNLPTGKYNFHADYTYSNTQFSLRVNGSWVKALAATDEIEIDANNTNEIYFSNSTAGTYTITGIEIIPQQINGKIPTLETAVDTLTVAVDDMQEAIGDITVPTISEIDGVETLNTVVSSAGNIIEGGTTNYRTIKYEVTPEKTYWVTANTNWGNLLFAWYDANNGLVEKGDASASGSADTLITNRESVAPVGAKYLIISYNITVSRGYVTAQTGISLVGKWQGKKWVCIGDSLTAENSRTTKHYFDYVAEKTGISTVNMGYSGSGYARLQGDNQAFYQRVSSCPTDADVVTIFGSFNDLGAGLPLGTVDDTETTTIAGCINTTITNLQTRIPLVNLGIVSPTPWDTTQPTSSGTDYNYVEMLKEICAHRSIPFLDLWRCSNLRPWDADFRTIAYSHDDGSGTHPDENGHKLIAPRFEGFLDTLLLH